MYTDKIKTQKRLLAILDDECALSQPVLDELSFLMSPSDITDENLGFVSKLLAKVSAPADGVNLEEIRKKAQTELAESIALYEISDQENAKPEALQRIVNALALLCRIPKDKRTDEDQLLQYQINRAYYEMLRDYLNPSPKTEHELFIPDAALMQYAIKDENSFFKTRLDRLVEQYQKKRHKHHEDGNYTEALLCSLHIVEMLLYLPEEKMSPKRWGYLRVHARYCSYYLYGGYKNEDKNTAETHNLIAADKAWKKANEFRTKTPASKKTEKLEENNPKLVSLIEQATRKVEAQIFGSTNDAYFAAKMPYAHQMYDRIHSHKTNLYLKYYKETEGEETSWKLKYQNDNDGSRKFFDTKKKEEVPYHSYPDNYKANVVLAKQTHIANCFALSCLFVYEAESLLRERKRQYENLSDAEKTKQAKPQDLKFMVVSVNQINHALVLIKPAKNWKEEDDYMCVDLWAPAFGRKRYYCSDLQSEMKRVAENVCSASYKKRADGRFTFTMISSRDTSSDKPITDEIDKLDRFPQLLDERFFSNFLKKRQANMQDFSEKVVQELELKTIQSIDSNYREKNKNLSIKEKLKKRCLYELALEHQDNENDEDIQEKVGAVNRFFNADNFEPNDDKVFANKAIYSEQVLEPILIWCLHSRNRGNSYLIHKLLTNLEEDREFINSSFFTGLALRLAYNTEEKDKLDTNLSDMAFLMAKANIVCLNQLPPKGALGFNERHIRSDRKRQVKNWNLDARKKATKNQTHSLLAEPAFEKIVIEEMYESESSTSALIISINKHSPQWVKENIPAYQLVKINNGNFATVKDYYEFIEYLEHLFPPWKNDDVVKEIKAYIDICGVDDNLFYKINNLLKKHYKNVLFQVLEYIRDLPKTRKHRSASSNVKRELETLSEANWNNKSEIPEIFTTPYFSYLKKLNLSYNHRQWIMQNTPENTSDECIAQFHSDLIKHLFNKNTCFFTNTIVSLMAAHYELEMPALKSDLNRLLDTPKMLNKFYIAIDETSTYSLTELQDIFSEQICNQALDWLKEYRTKTSRLLKLAAEAERQSEKKQRQKVEEKPQHKNEEIVKPAEEKSEKQAEGKDDAAAMEIVNDPFEGMQLDELQKTIAAALNNNADNYEDSVNLLKDFFAEDYYSSLKEAVFDKIDDEIQRLTPDDSSSFRATSTEKLEQMNQAKENLVQIIVDSVTREDQIFDQKALHKAIKKEVHQLAENKTINTSRNKVQAFFKGLLGVLICFTGLGIIYTVAKRNFFFGPESREKVLEIDDALVKEGKQLNKQ